MTLATLQRYAERVLADVFPIGYPVRVWQGRPDCLGNVTTIVEKGEARIVAGSRYECLDFLRWVRRTGEYPLTVDAWQKILPLFE